MLTIPTSPPLPDNPEDMDAVIESISYGKTQSLKKLQFQAFTAAISHSDQLPHVLSYLCSIHNTTH